MPISLLNKIIFGAKRLAYQLKEKPKAQLDDHVLEHMVFYHGLTGSVADNEKETKLVRADIKEAISDKNGHALCLALKLLPTLWQDRLNEIFSQFGEEQKQTAIKLLAPGAEEIENSLSAADGSNSFAVAYPDWRVKANAANILSFLDAKTAAPALSMVLGSNTVGGAMSFCYIAYALGKLQGEQARTALEQQLKNEDQWLRTDAAGALACFDFDSTAKLLAQALLGEEERLDYMAYAISRQHKPAKFLQAADQQLVKGGARLIYGLLEAAQNSFTSDLIFETECHLCLPMLNQLIEKSDDPILIDVQLALQEWLCRSEVGGLKPAPTVSPEGVALQQAQQPGGNVDSRWADKSRPYESNNVDTRVGAELGRTHERPYESLDAVSQRVVNNLKAVMGGQSIGRAELTHTINIAGKLKIKEAVPLLIELLQDNNNSLLSPVQVNSLIAALGNLNDERAVSMLIDYAYKLVDMDDRTQKPKSKQPVWEDEPDKAKTYWQILKTLGNLQLIAPVGAACSDPFQLTFPHGSRARVETTLSDGTVGAPVSIPRKDRQHMAECRGEIYPPIDFLHTALSDYAPDKRTAALESLVNLYTHNPDLKLPQPIGEIIQLSLKDPAPLMQLAALAAAATLEQFDLVPDIVQLIDSQENTVSKQAIATVAALYKSAKNGAKGNIASVQNIEDALHEKLKTIREEHKKLGILDILQ